MNKTKTGLTTSSKTPAQKIQEFYSAVELEQAKKENDIAILCNADPAPSWIKINKFAGNSKYIPIGRIEFMLTYLFGKWRLEVKEYKVMANSITCSVRLHYYDPSSSEWSWQDGVGAVPIQVAKNESPADVSKINSSAIQMGLPSAESYAFKDAAEKIGKVFGKDLNRTDFGDYNILKTKFADLGVDNAEKNEQ